MNKQQMIESLEEVNLAIGRVISSEEFVYDEAGDDLVMKQHWLTDVIEQLKSEIDPTFKKWYEVNPKTPK